MPREIRKIILSREEMAEAVDSFRRVRKDLLPPGTILSVEEAKGPSVTVHIEMRFGPNVRNDEFVLENEHLVETMIRFCLENNIIVPRGGKKTVRCIDQEWLLEIKLHDSEMAHLATSGRIEPTARVRTGIAAGSG